MVADNIQRIRDADNRTSEDEIALNMSLKQCDEFAEKMQAMHRGNNGPPKSILAILEQLQAEVARLSAKVEQS